MTGSITVLKKAYDNSAFWSAYATDERDGGEISPNGLWENYHKLDLTGEQKLESNLGP